MPVAPLGYCTNPTCGNRTAGSYCTNCAPYSDDTLTEVNMRRATTGTCRGCGTPMTGYGYCTGCMSAATINHGKLTVVTGAPCSGKNTHVAQHRGSNDLVVDYDALAVALGRPDSHGGNDAYHPFVCEARDAAIRRLSRQHDIAHTWIIRCAPTRQQRAVFPGAQVVILDTSADECHRRADEAGRPALWHRLIDEHFAAYEPPL